MSTDKLFCYLRLYSVGIVLTVWAITWNLGIRGDGPVGWWLALTAVTAVLSQREAVRLRHESTGR